ncbi:MAG: hypothetical protein ACJ8F7_04440 [Gemmataceae bacterium]
MGRIRRFLRPQGCEPQQPIAIEKPAEKGRKFQHPLKDDTLPMNFAAYGTSEHPKPGDIGSTKGLLLDKHGHPIGLARLETIHERPNWVIVFEGVPAGEDYTVEITFFDGKKIKSEKFSVPTKEVNINYPGDDANVCNTFVSYGTNSVTQCMARVSGTMTGQPSGSPVIDGATIQQPSGRCMWVIQFTNVPDSGVGGSSPDNYRLDVTNTAGGADFKQRIHVSASNC